MVDKKPKYPYGALNPIQVPKFGEIFDSNEDSNLDRMKQLVRKFYDNKIDVAGDYTGYVLAIVPEQNEPSAIERIWGAIGGSLYSKPKYKEVKVRVPEIHSWIPEPKDEKDYYTIGLHDTFLALEGLPNLAYGTFVKVTFYDGAGKYQPTIKEVLTEGNNPLGQNEISAKSISVNSSIPRGIAASGPVGNGIKGNPPQPPLDYLDYSVPIRPKPLMPIDNKTRVELNSAIPYEENRVRTTDTGIGFLPANSPLLIEVESRYGNRQKLHILVKNRFDALVAAAAKEGIKITCQSGWRKPWSSREEYDRFIDKEYVNNSNSQYYYTNYVKDGHSVQRAKEISADKASKVKAYQSAHFSGLAVDFHIPPVVKGEYDVAPSMPGNSSYGNTNSEQKKSTGFLWLKKNAHLFGFTPLISEAWHWEVLLPIGAWRTGEEFTSNYAVRVAEVSLVNNTKTTMREFSV